MAFLRKQTSEGSIAVLYSLIQKCIRRGLEEESLYYSEIPEFLISFIFRPVETRGRQQD